MLSAIPALPIINHWSHYAHYLQARAGVAASEMDVEVILDHALPPSMVVNALTSLPLEGGAVAAVVGVLLTGGEHAFGTWKLSLTQGPGRLEVLSAKAVTLALALTTALGAAFAASAGASVLIAVIEREPVALPAASYIAEGLGSGLLILLLWGFVGLLLGTLLKSTGLAMGAALLHMTAVEGGISTAAQASAAARAIAEWLIWGNAATLVARLRENTIVLGMDIPPSRAVLTLCAYAAAALAASSLAIARRDVA